MTTDDLKLRISRTLGVLCSVRDALADGNGVDAARVQYAIDILSDNPKQPDGDLLDSLRELPLAPGSRFSVHSRGYEWTVCIGRKGTLSFRRERHLGEE